MIINCPQCGSHIDWDKTKSCLKGHAVRAVADIPLCFTPDDILVKKTADPYYPLEHAIGIAEKLALADTCRQAIDIFFDIHEAELNKDLTLAKKLFTNRQVSEVNDCIADGSLFFDKIGKPFPSNDRFHIDIGCGVGHGLVSSSKSYFGPNVIGIDLSPHYLTMAKLLLKEHGVAADNLVCADICEGWPFPLEKYDISFISMEGVLEHIEHTDNFFATVKKIKSYPFAIYLTVPYRWSIHPESHFNMRFIGWLPKILQDRYIAWRRGANKIVHVELYSISSLRQTLERYFTSGSIAIELNDNQPFKHHYLRCLIYINDANCFK